MKRGRTYSMEDFFGALLLIGALFALGLFNFRSDEPLVEAGIRAQASAITAQSVHGLRAVVDGRDITLQGLADSETEEIAMLEELRKIEGRAKLYSEVTVLEAMEPFTFGAQLEGTDQIAFSGGVPSEVIRGDLQEDFGDGVVALTLASGAPDAEWSDVATAGLRALSQLDRGVLKLQGRTLRLTGDALTPDIRDRALLLLDILPPDYAMSHEIMVLDDGSPLRLNVAKSDGGTPRVSGKLPADIADQLNAVEGAEITISPLPVPFTSWGQGLLAAVGALDHLQSGHLAVIGPSLTLTGEAWSQVDYDAVMAAVEAMPTPMQMSVDILLADSGAPFGLELVLDSGMATATGKVPRSLSAPVLSALVGLQVEASELEIARISPAQEWWDVARLGVEGLRRADSGEMRFDGETLTLNVLLENPQTADELTADLADLSSDVTLALDITLIDDGTPLRLSLVFDGTAAAVSGKLPDSLSTELLGDALGVTVQTGDVITTPKAQPVGWQDMVGIGAQALSRFTSGRLEITGDQLHLAGTVLNPAREREVMSLLETVPEGYDVTIDLTFQDDGRPFAFRLTFDGERAVLSGKTPSDLGPASQAAILGFPVAAEALEFAAIPADTEWWIAARAGLKAVAILSEGVLSVDAHQITLQGIAKDSTDADAIAGQLAPFQDDFDVKIDLLMP